MDGNLSLEQAKIINAIMDGSLTRESVQKGLAAIVDTELLQNDHPADMELVNACIDLLHCLDESGVMYACNREMSLEKAKKKLRKHHTHKKVVNQFVRVAAVMLVFLISGVLWELLADREFLIALPTFDEQQYQIQGVVTKTEFISTGVANESTIRTFKEAATLGQALELLSFDPQIPSWLPDEWTLVDFNIVISPLSEQLSLTYGKMDERLSTKINAFRYENPEDAITNFEQSANGKEYEWNGKTVYLARNIDTYIAVWTSGTIYYSISTPLDQQDIQKIIESIKE